MSVINKMLRDLDRRHALPNAASGDANVRVVPEVRRSDAFWITLGVTAVVALGWMSWVVYELQPRQLATTLALSRPASPSRPLVPAAPPATPAPPVAVAPAAPAPKEPEPSPSAKPAPEIFKLAESIETPIAPRPAPKQTPKPARLPPEQAIALPPTTARAASQELSKRDRPLTNGELAEMRFQSGVQRLNQGRASAAASDFVAALGAEPSHEAARQALVAVRLEQSEIDAAEELLRQGLAISPSNAQFATVLARIRVERGDYEGAAAALSRTNEAGANDAEHQMLFGTVLQRLGRDREAIVAFENAARLAEPQAAAWVAMGISYENVGARGSALRAYRQSLAAGGTDAIRSYAEDRIRALN